MVKYVYPAIFTPEERGFSIDFPDIESCYTCGDDLIDGIEMAEDILASRLYDMESAGEAIPAPSAFGTLGLKDGEFTTLVHCDTIVYRKRKNGKAVKKTLSIPQWMDEMATEKGINFSKVLQDALASQLLV
ncbi:MAG: type II toxin-antitoxin system HicB family antitoxin [Clostridiales Family XIII bacterium]|nr:type II toxin-antitoxin system HicB family antitoxin [Clostridiales Family XIII bacterium]